MKNQNYTAESKMNQNSSEQKLELYSSIKHEQKLIHITHKQHMNVI